ncbi:MAG: nicotinate-nucleotide adenylyltransferase [Desulfobacteraceae bacterium]
MSETNHLKKQYPVGVIHGRFQVLHNDHLKYILAGKERCRELVIAITNPTPNLTRSESADPHRSLPIANPLTYYERYQLIRTAMTGAGQDSNSYSIVPLPISMPEQYQYYVPLDAVFFLTIYDDWGRRKYTYFNSLGLKVDVLWNIPVDKKGISGSHVRRLMLDSNAWEAMVPSNVADLLNKWRLPERLRKLMICSEKSI